MKHLLLLSILIFSTQNFANAQSAEDPAKTQRILSFEEFKQACQNPARFHNQVAPTNIQVTCNDVQYKWLPLKESVVSLGTRRTVSSSIASDKYSMSEIIADVDSAFQPMSCPHFKQVAEHVQTVRTVTCDELLAFQAGATEFCSDAVNSLRAANSESITTEDTGQVVNLCKAEFKTLSRF